MRHCKHQYLSSIGGTCRQCIICGRKEQLNINQKWVKSNFDGDVSNVIDGIPLSWRSK